MVERIIYAQMGSGWRELYVKKYLPKVMAALRSDTRVREVFKNKKKADAIEDVWGRRDRLFANLQEIPTSFDAPCYEITPDDDRVVEWCGKLPFLGPITKYLPARDFGANVPKPDLWMGRFADY